MLAFISAIVTLINGLYASYQVQRKQLIQQTLDTNWVYARKMAASADGFLKSAQQQLAYSAGELAPEIDDFMRVQQTVDRLYKQSDSFNSVFIAGSDGVVLATSPATLQLVGVQLRSEGAAQALAQRKPLISVPYLAVSNNLLVLISHPLFSPNGEYLGFVGGTLYLKERNILNELLVAHDYKDGSYLYVVDQNRRLLYHPDPQRVGTQVTGNAVIEAVIKGQDGAQAVSNSLGIEMLAGYAPVSKAGWGIVTQRPLASTLAILDTQMRAVMQHALPLALLTLVLLWWLARLIARPLWQLADSAHALDHPGSPERIARVRSWYFESAELKRALLLGVNLLHSQIGKLRNDVQTDPLTGLSNRRGSEHTLERLRQQGVPFSVLMLDIDHFKRVNDTFGHDVGDRVLQTLGRLMQGCIRQGDLACRMGGEEFMVLLPRVDLSLAATLAERLRKRVVDTDWPEVGQVTISIGLAAWSEPSEDTAQVVKYADQALYRAKQQGRNRIEVHRSLPERDAAICN